MVEASMVFPLVILAVIGIIGMMLFFYRQVEVQCKMDMVLRQEVARRTETGECLQRISSDGISLKEKDKRIYAGKTVFFSEQGLLESRNKTMEANNYLVEWGALIRRWDRMTGKDGSTHSEK